MLTNPRPLEVCRRYQSAHQKQQTRNSIAFSVTNFIKNPRQKIGLNASCAWNGHIKNVLGLKLMTLHSFVKLMSPNQLPC
uniref:Uncharacterized protein n=1 Tax=Octopus bimaculoides TaxID=37653 RepID=A0A0L8HG64_OCTBM